MNLLKLPKVATRALAEEVDQDDGNHSSDTSPRGSPRAGHNFASTVLRGTASIINQATFVRVVTQPGADSKDLRDLFDFCKPRQKLHSNTSALLKLTPKQHDAMYALAGCSDVGNVASKVSAAAREAMNDVFGIDKQRFSTWFKNRRLRSSSRKGFNSPRSGSPAVRSQPSSPGRTTLGHANPFSQPATPQRGSRLARGHATHSPDDGGAHAWAQQQNLYDGAPPLALPESHRSPMGHDLLGETWSADTTASGLTKSLPHQDASTRMDNTKASNGYHSGLGGLADDGARMLSCPSELVDWNSLPSPGGVFVTNSNNLFFGTNRSSIHGASLISVPEHFTQPMSVQVPGAKLDHHGHAGVSGQLMDFPVANQLECARQQQQQQHLQQQLHEQQQLQQHLQMRAHEQQRMHQHLQQQHLLQRQAQQSPQQQRQQQHQQLLLWQHQHEQAQAAHGQAGLHPLATGAGMGSMDQVPSMDVWGTENASHGPCAVQAHDLNMLEPEGIFDTFAAEI
mmetsp:Transcript_33225/g.98961  ORF Transcript_33225/g.98961 Transcript_33225/m.98961 type:complete len:510 (-) Transcript_33225:1148-2677(-)